MTTRPNKRRILVVDDHPIVRERLAEIINKESDLMVCGQAESRAQTLSLINKAKPDLVLLDLNLTDSKGTDFIKELIAANPDLVILVISMHDESLFAERSIRAGARGYITKQEATKDILTALRKVLAGDVYLNDETTHRLITKMAGGTSAGITGPNADELSDREMQVFRMIGLGISTRQISEELNLDVSTIDTYRKRIKDKLNLKDASELLSYAISWVRATGQQ